MCVCVSVSVDDALHSVLIYFDTQDCFNGEGINNLCVCGEFMFGQVQSLHSFSCSSPASAKPMQLLYIYYGLQSLDNSAVLL